MDGIVHMIIGWIGNGILHTDGQFSDTIDGDIMPMVGTVGINIHGTEIGIVITGGIIKIVRMVILIFMDQELVI